MSQLTTPTLGFTGRRPVSFVALVWVGVLILYIIAGAVSQVQHLGSVPQTILANAGVVLLGLAVTAGLNWWREVGLTHSGIKDARLLLLLPLVATLQPLLGGVAPITAGQAAGLALLALLVGFTEELLFRGVILRGLQPLGPVRAALFSALLFGVPHLLNALSGRDVGASLIQVAYAVVIGVLFAAIRLRTGALWPLVLLHALTNFVVWASEGGLGGGAAPTVGRLVLTVVFGAAMLAQAIWMLRSPKAN